MSSSRSTYSTMSRWHKWSSLFILLIPITIFGLSIAKYINKLSPSTYDDVTKILDYILLILSIIWIILGVILFFAAGTVKDKTSPLAIRIGLLVSFALVLSPIIIQLLVNYGVIDDDSKPIGVVTIFLPLIIAIGYFVAFCCAKKAQRETV